MDGIADMGAPRGHPPRVDEPVFPEPLVRGCRLEIVARRGNRGQPQLHDV